MASNSAGIRFDGLHDTSQHDHEALDLRDVTWRGNQKFYCNGRIVVGHNQMGKAAVYVAYILIFTFTVSFCAFPGVYLWKNVSPMFTIIDILLFFAIYYNMIAATFSDPGIVIPGNVEEHELALSVPSENQNGVNIDENAGNQNEIPSADGYGFTNANPVSDRNTSQALQPANYKEMKIDFYRERYCKTCKIIRPPKASHCNDCGTCIREYDHHCYFIGNCVGERNAKHFLLFLFFTSCKALFTIIASVVVLVETFLDHPSIWDKFMSKEGLLIAAGILLVVGCYCSGIRFMGELKYLPLMISLGIIVGNIAYAAQGLDLKYYEYPFWALVYIVMGLPFGFGWIIPLTFNNCYNAMKGITLKERIALHRQAQIDHKSLLLATSFRENFSNIIKFVTAPSPRSEVRERLF